MIEAAEAAQRFITSSEFELARPRILGALLDAAAHGLQMLPQLRLPWLPLMADFALWVAACETGFRPEGAFEAVYSNIARWRCQFWADCITNISERKFPTGTADIFSRRIWISSSCPKYLKFRFSVAMPIKILRHAVDLVIESGLRKPQELIQKIHEPVSVLGQEYLPSFEHRRNNRQSSNSRRARLNIAHASAFPRLSATGTKV